MGTLRSDFYFHQKYVEEILKKYFPNISSSFYFLGGANAETPYRSAELILSGSNHDIKGSPFWMKAKGAKFIHYTSIEKLTSILREKSFRLYALNAMDDPYEAIEKGKINNDVELDIQHKIQCFSFCEFSIEEREDSLEMWRLYGNNCNGCGLVFSIDNPKYDFSAYGLAKINYKSEELFDRFVEESQRFFEENKVELRNFDILKTMMKCLTKSKIYKNEKEVRLVYLEDFVRKEFYSSYDLYSNILEQKTDDLFMDFRNGKKTNFRRLSIDINKNIQNSKEATLKNFDHFKKFHKNGISKETLFKMIYHSRPNIKLEEIILGPKVGMNVDLIDVIEYHLRQLGLNNVRVRRSNLSSYFGI